MKPVTLHLEITLPSDTLATEVGTFLAACKYILRGVFPTAKMKCVTSPKRKKKVDIKTVLMTLN